LADGLGVRVDDIQETVERIPAEISFDTPTGHIAAGTIAGMRSTLTGYVDGKPTLPWSFARPRPAVNLFRCVSLGEPVNDLISRSDGVELFV